VKTLIAYCSRTGSCKKCAQIIAGYFPGAECVDLDEKQPKVSAYDLVIIGGFVRIGQFAPGVKRFIRMKKDGLLQKHTAFFACAARPQPADEILKEALGEELSCQALGTACFTGDLSPDELFGMEKFAAVKLLRSTHDAHPEKTQEALKLDTDSVDAFAKKLKSKLDLLG